MTRLVWNGAGYSRLESSPPPPRRASRAAFPFFAPLLIAWTALFIMLLSVPRAHCQPATSRPASDTPKALLGPAFAQVTLSPDWGARIPLPVSYITNVQVKSAGLSPDAVRAEWRRCVSAYQLVGVPVGFYIAGDLFIDADEIYYPPVQITADPSWPWAGVRYWRKRGGVPDVTLYNGGLRYTLDRSDPRTFRRVVDRAATLLTQRISECGMRPDFLFFDNCGHQSAGGPDNLLVWCDYVELVASKVRLAGGARLPIMLNVSGTPADWSADEFSQVEFLSEILRSDGRWLGFYFEQAHLAVQRGDGVAKAVDTAAFSRLLAARCPVLWDITDAPRGATSAETTANFVAAQRRMSAVARATGTDAHPLVAANWFAALPEFLRPAVTTSPAAPTDPIVPAAAAAPSPTAAPRRRRLITGIRLPGRALTTKEPC